MLDVVAAVANKHGGGNEHAPTSMLVGLLFFCFSKSYQCRVKHRQQWLTSITADMPLLVQNSAMKTDFEPAVISITGVVGGSSSWTARVRFR